MVKRQYVWSLAYVDALVLRDRDTDGNAGTGHIAMYGSGFDERLYVLQDANWNTTALTTTAGAVVERYMYSPYGVVNIRNWDWSLNSNPGGSYQWVYLHQGGRWNADAGLYHFRHRDYSPTLGRWMNQDPLGYVDGGNLYEYVGGNPAIRSDSLGLAWKIERTWGARAKATGECGDTIADLAKQTNMEPSAYSKWLKPLGDSQLPSSADEGLESRSEFTVPNTVVVAVGSAWRLATRLNSAPANDAYTTLNAKGFAVNFYNYDLTGQFGASDFKNAWDLYGVVYFGHGLSGYGKKKWTGVLYDDPLKGALDPSADGSTGYIPAETFYPGQLGLLVLKSCFADQGDWSSRASSTAHAAGAVWLGSGFEAAGVVFGLRSAIEAAK